VAIQKPMTMPLERGMLRSVDDRADVFMLRLLATMTEQREQM
jgi:hypothetical protein